MPDTSQIPGSPCICFRMRRATQRIKDFYDETLAPSGVTVSQYSLLANLDRMEGCGTGELARAVRHEKSTLVRTLQPLLQAGLIEDCAPESSRRRRLYLTGEGKRVLETALPLWKEAQKMVHSRLGGSSRELFELLSVIDGL